IRDMASSEEGREYMGEVIKAVDEVAKIRGLDNGFRVINNCGPDGGQTVMHAHYHVIGGIKLTEKMI
ncbi:MAG: HIT domain-containing protein, partial [Clostridiales bacterium]|nr:HIT domain-containing protein [Clostridiales bacterium]